MITPAAPNFNATQLGQVRSGPPAPKKPKSPPVPRIVSPSMPRYKSFRAPRMRP